MYIQLMHRRYGIHKPIKHIEIPCDFSEVYQGQDIINEELLLENIPEGWLPVPPERILLMVANENGGAGQCCTIFHSWAKYFDSYSLELHEKPKEWWDEQPEGE